MMKEKKSFLKILIETKQSSESLAEPLEESDGAASENLKKKHFMNEVFHWIRISQRHIIKWINHCSLKKTY